MLYRIGRDLCVLFTRILFRVRLVGRERIPTDRGFVLVSNHRTNFDPILVAAGVRAQICYMAKAELFRNKLLGAILHGVGSFPVERGKGDTGAIAWAEQVIRDGRVLGMFPEGTRSPEGKLSRPRSGAALVAMQTGADVLPCAVCFGEKLGFRSTVTIVYGNLVHNAEFGFTPGATSPHELKNASHRMMAEIAGLLEENC